MTVDLHCVTRWSKLGTTWRGVSLDILLTDVESAADYVLVHSYGGYTTNLPLEDVLDGQAWIAYEYEGEPLEPVHGGPARLLVPHLYLLKSAKGVRGLQLRNDDEPGVWEPRLSQLRSPMARTALRRRLGPPWRAARLVAAGAETGSARTMRFAVDGWPGHRPGQHVDVRLTAA